MYVWGLVLLSPIFFCKNLVEEVINMAELLLVIISLAIIYKIFELLFKKAPK